MVQTDVGGANIVIGPLDQLLRSLTPAANQSIAKALSPKHQPTKLQDILSMIVAQSVQKAARPQQQQVPAPLPPPKVPENSYIMPADVVAAKGNGSTEAGAEAYAPLGGTLIQGPGDGRSDDVQALGPSGPIALSNGEVHIPPHGVAAAGGPEALDKDARDTRSDFRQHLAALPPPRT